MNPASDLTIIANKFTKRIDKLRTEALADNLKIERYCIVAISQLNNFLRSYLLSIRGGACDSNGGIPSFGKNYTSDDLLIDEIIRIGYPKRWKSGKVSTWLQKDEPALHCPKVFMTVVNGLNCSNTPSITTAMMDSWKIDVLRDVRNYFAHRCISTEIEAVTSVKKRYSVNARAAKILLEKDISISSVVIDDLHDYLKSFSINIC